MESETTLQKNPLLVDINTPANKSTTNAWFSKVFLAASCVYINQNSDNTSHVNDDDVIVV